jgi:predicted RNA-binding Zn-ribbon protein involved in translation (DUF1610 family)
MAMHLFATPVQCTNCGTVVDNPIVDRCPKCGNLLRERRTPSRLAGVERRYGQLRVLIGLLRFLGVITVVVGVLLFMYAEEATLWTDRIMDLLATILIAAALFVVAALIDVALDVEENTRSTFRLQQQLLEILGGEKPRDVGKE